MGPRAARATKLAAVSMTSRAVRRPLLMLRSDSIAPRLGPSILHFAFCILNCDDGPMPVVAVIGASNDRHKFGNKALRAFRAQGYTVVPINPRERNVEGERTYATVLEYPGAIDEATLYVPPEVGVQVLDDIAAKGIKTIWLNPGADGDAV